MKITVMVLFTRVPPARSDGLVLVGAELFERVVLLMGPNSQLLHSCTLGF